MNIKKIVKKIDNYFDLSQKKQDEKKQKLLDILEKLMDKKLSIQKEIKKASSKKDKDELNLELKAIKNLIKKASIE